MKYVYYEKDSGEIKIISPVREADSPDPFIEVEDAEVDHLHSGNSSTFMFFVKPLSRTSPVGKLVKKRQADPNWKSINDWLYLIPNIEPELIEFKITQNISNKTITITVDPQAQIFWKSVGFYQRKQLPISACSGADPHNWVWVKMIDTQDLLADITFSYEGTDDLRFYTHRFFDCYYHEQLT
jgi:hypothetical protein